MSSHKRGRSGLHKWLNPHILTGQSNSRGSSTTSHLNWDKYFYKTKPHYRPTSLHPATAPSPGHCPPIQTTTDAPSRAPLSPPDYYAQSHQIHRKTLKPGIQGRHIPAHRSSQIAPRSNFHTDMGRTATRRVPRRAPAHSIWPAPPPHIPENNMHASRPTRRRNPP